MDDNQNYEYAIPQHNQIVQTNQRPITISDLINTFTTYTQPRQFMLSFNDENPLNNFDELEPVRVKLTRSEINDIPIIEYNEDEDDPKCGVCQGDIIQNQRIRTLNCNHFFHADCIDPWLAEQSTKCPTCRSDQRIS
jgi:hypothetical protein